MAKSGRPWWQATERPWTSFLAALVAGLMALRAQNPLFVALDVFLAVSFLLSGVMLLRTGEPFVARHRPRVKPFWPPED